MDIYIRRAVECDQPAIKTLIREAGINPFHLHWQNFIVAQASQGVVGCGQLRPHGDGSAELASLAVRQDWQGRGIGAALMQTLISTSAGGLFLMCEGRMQPYYEAFGFEVVSAGELPREMRFFFGLGQAFTWAARTLFGQPARIVAMRLAAE